MKKRVVIEVTEADWRKARKYIRESEGFGIVSKNCPVAIATQRVLGDAPMVNRRYVTVEEKQWELDDTGKYLVDAFDDPRNRTRGPLPQKVTLRRF